MEAAEFTVVTMILLFFERIILTPGVDFRSTSVAYFYLRRPVSKKTGLVKMRCILCFKENSCVHDFPLDTWSYHHIR